MWGCMLEIPIPKKLRWKNYGFKASMDYMARLQNNTSITGFFATGLMRTYKSF